MDVHCLFFLSTSTNVHASRFSAKTWLLEKTFRFNVQKDAIPSQLRIYSHWQSLSDMVLHIEPKRNVFRGSAIAQACGYSTFLPVILAYIYFSKLYKGTWYGKKGLCSDADNLPQRGWCQSHVKSLLNPASECLSQPYLSTFK